jgi:hypothetical protein
MPQSHKIATCSYCGTRAALVLDRGRHELACGSCGAPLHDMKMMPVYRDGAAKRGAAPGRREKVRIDWDAERRHALGDHEPRRHSKPRKRRKPLARKVLGEIWDVVEDIFD